VSVQLIYVAGRGWQKKKADKCGAIFIFFLRENAKESRRIKRNDLNARFCLPTYQRDQITV
jgi:hypothetical protein